jgi:opacity protein-like surface antigen
MKAIFAAVLLAMAVASPALAQSAQSQDNGRGYGGTYHGYPTSEWYRPDGY